MERSKRAKRKRVKVKGNARRKIERTPRRFAVVDPYQVKPANINRVRKAYGF